MNSPAPGQSTQLKKPSSKPSIAGAVLSILGLILSAIGSALVNSKYKPEQTSTTAAEKAGEAVASGTWRVLATIFSVPFLVVGIVLGLLAVLFTVLRLKKVKIGGLVLSVFWILISVWAIKIAISAFQVIKAH